MPPRLTPKNIADRKDVLRLHNIELIDEYKGSDHENNFRCLRSECEHEWSATFDRVWRHKTCTACLGKVVSKKVASKRVAELEERNIKLMSPFTGMSHKHDFACLIDSYQWSTVFASVYTSGNGCSICSGMRVTKSEIEKRNATFKLRNILCLEDYKGALKKHNFLCLAIDCNHEWSATFDGVTRGKGCPVCSGYLILPETTETRILELRIERNIQLLEPYKGTQYKHWFKCLLDDHKWQAEFACVYSSKQGCPKCGGQALTDEERKNSNIHRKIRNNIASRFYRGYIDAKPYKTNNQYNWMINYAMSQYKFLPPIPNDEEKWEVDHIIPVSWFDAHDIEQLKLCWHKNNLRWLTRRENTSKGNRIRPQDLGVFTDWHYSACKKASYRKPLPVC